MFINVSTQIRHDFNNLRTILNHQLFIFGVNSPQ